MHDSNEEIPCEYAHGKLGVSLRKFSRRYHIHKKHVRNILKDRNVTLINRKSAQNIIITDN